MCGRASRVEVLASSVVYVPDRRNETRYGLRDLRAHSSVPQTSPSRLVSGKGPNHGTQDGHPSPRPPGERGGTGNPDRAGGSSIPDPVPRTVH